MEDQNQAAAETAPTEPQQKTALARKFLGIVHLKEWIKLADGKNYSGVYGWVTVLTTQEAVGFAPGDREANWLVIVHKGEEPGEGASFVVFNGCQIRGFQAVKNQWSVDKDFYTVED
jgi:hypothetical protein